MQAAFKSAISHEVLLRISFVVDAGSLQITAELGVREPIEIGGKPFAGRREFAIYVRQNAGVAAPDRKCRDRQWIAS